MPCIFCLLRKKDILYETAHFFVYLGIGIVAPGHVMILTKEHLPSFAYLPKDLWEEYFFLKQNLITFLTHHIAEPFLVEYGPGLQSVAHAHVHFIPKQGLGYQIKSILHEMVRPGNILLHPVDFQAFQQWVRKHFYYVYFEEDQQGFVAEIPQWVFTQGLGPHLGYRAFFHRLEKDIPVSWKLMTQEQKKKDAMKRKKTRELFQQFSL